MRKTSISAWILALSAALGCDASERAAGERAAPTLERHTIAVGSPLPELAFDGVAADGSPARLDLDAAATGADRLLLVVSGGTWCGTCRWLARPLEELLGPAMASRLARLDLVLGDHVNDTPGLEAARAWRALGVEGPVAVDPLHRLRALFKNNAALPLVVLIDPATMTVTDAITNPTTRTLRRRVAASLGMAPGEEAPLIDDRFDENEWALLRETTLPTAVPADPTSAYADDPRAAALGRALFFDAGLSPLGVSCAHCHRPERQLHGDGPVGVGASAGRRRAPSVALAAFAPRQLWDGRAETLGSQALLPMEDPTEMASTRVQVARRLLTEHRAAYVAVFGRPSVETDDWPEAGMPGMPAFDALPATTRTAITEIFVHAGEAIAAWERTLRVAPNPLDAYLAGDLDALTPEQKYGLQAFVRHGCQQCHWGPRLTDDAFHNVGMPSRVTDGQIDRGRYDVVERPSARHVGQFKTPPLRGVAHAAFFGHAGMHPDLGMLMTLYGFGPGEDALGEDAVGEREPWLPPFGETVQWGLVPFLEALTAEVSPPLAPKAPGSVAFTPLPGRS